MHEFKRDELETGTDYGFPYRDGSHFWGGYRGGVSIRYACPPAQPKSAAFASEAEGYDPTGPTGDIGRILQGLISGIGILGAGVFLNRGGTVRLATTGASVWLAGAVGVSYRFAPVPAGAAQVMKHLDLCRAWLHAARQPKGSPQAMRCPLSPYAPSPERPAPARPVVRETAWGGLRC